MSFSFLRFTAFTLSVVLTSASDPVMEAMRRLDTVQVRSLALMGPFLQKHNLPAPWMKTSDHEQFRRLQSSMVSLPSACTAACPSADNMMKGLQEKMLGAMMKHQDVMQSMAQSSPSGGENTDFSQIAKMLEKLTPMYSDIMTVTFDDMCANQESYQCLVTNADKCNTESQGMNMNDPASMAKDFGPQAKCFCDVCPGARKAYAEMSSKMMGLFMNAMTSAFGAMASGGDGNSSDSSGEFSSLEKDVMAAFCPMVGMTRCFEQNPTQCFAMMEGTTSKGMSQIGMSVNNSDLAGLKANCTKAGKSWESTPLPKVSTMLTIKGLDFAKVESNSEIKTELVSKIQAQVLAKLKGYTSDDLKITLSAGSVKANVEVTPMPGSSSTLLQSNIATEKDAIATAVVADVKTMPNVNAVLQSGTTADKLEATADAPQMETTATAVASSATYSAGVVSLCWALMSQMTIFS